jgi:hypothetical protein
MWKNERINKLEKQVADLEMQLQSMVWFQDEIIHAVKEFLEMRNMVVEKKEKPK